MATQAARIAPADCSLPLYRMDVELFERLVEAGALEGLDVELRGGLLVDRGRNGGDPVHRLDIETYDRMVETGALEDEPVELLDGLLVEMSPQGDSHIAAIVLLTRHFGMAQAWLMVQLPLDARPRSKPEPDLALVRDGPRPDWRSPGAALLTIEIAMTSHRKDRGKKLQIYAQAGVPAYWLVDIPGRAIEVRTDPGPGGYGHCEIYGPGATVPSPAEGVPDLDVAWLFAGLGD
ncbi:MAG TPA: Uma2 family endonuclease [Solirubrobacteraceae bacterium]|jgi:Uma2 family endonuclease|nr:Uma2 family endonuclease [Solirubrobacteraceae bacterium]